MQLCVRVGEARSCTMLDQPTGVLPVTASGVIMPNAGGAGYYRFSLPEAEWRALIGQAASLPPGGKIEGDLQRLGARWEVTVTPWIPAKLQDNLPEAVMKIDVQILWPGRAGERSLRLETVKGATIAYNNFDFQKAIENENPEISVNAMICLIKTASYLLSQQLKALEKAFINDGGLREKMTRARIEKRNKNSK